MGSKTRQQRYLEEVVHIEQCACGCGGDVEVKRGQTMPSYLRRRKHLGFFLPGHNVLLDAEERHVGSIRANRERREKGLKRRTSNPSGPEARAWKGGRRIRADGRVERRIGGEYVLEARLMVAQTLGRMLDSGELVHHRNEQIQDDTPENLELTTRAEHGRLHALSRERDAAGRFA